MNHGIEPTPLEDVRNWITAAAKMFVAAVLLGESFHACTRLLDHWHLDRGGTLPRAASPILVHLLLLALAAAFGTLKVKDCFPGHRERAGVRPWVAAVGIGWPLTLGLASAMTGQLWPGNGAPVQLPGGAWWVTSVLIAPVLEELVYRGLFARRLRARHGYLAGSYFAAVMFAWVHSWPSLAGFFTGHPGGVPPGPLLLALICDWLYVKTGSLWPAIAFHAACNATPAIFAALDPRWLQWFGAFYQ